MKKWLRVLKHTLITLLLSILMLEGMLMFIDPYGVVEYNQWVYWMVSTRIEHVTGYQFPAGVYHVQGDTVTIEADGTRHTPSHDEACTIAFIGDSVTFGWNVSDDETFVYLLDEMVEGVDFINTARPGYNIGNIVRLYTTTEADGFIYYRHPNDIEHASRVTPFANTYQSAIYLYVQYLSQPYIPVYARDMSRYEAVMERLVQEPMLTLDFPGGYEKASRFDGHPGAIGHQQIAQDILPHVEQYVSEICN